MWYGPAATVTRSRLGMRTPTGPIDSTEFTAILFQRTPDNEGNLPPIDPERLASQIEILHANGYQPVRATDIRHMLRHQDPLPRNALVLAVDGTDADLLRTLDTLTRRYRWGGIILTATQPPGRQDASITWQDLRSLRMSERWEIGLKGHKIEQTEQGRSHEEYIQSRINDHQAAIALAQRHLDFTPIVYAYPEWDAGLFSSRKDARARLGSQIAANSFDLAFLVTPLARNSMFTPPHRLNMLAVNPSWSGQQLLDTINRASVSIETLETVPQTPIASGWALDWGTVQPHTQGLTLRPAGDAEGARIWLGGTDQLRNFHASFQISKSDADLRFHFKHPLHQELGLTVSFETDGSVFLYDQHEITDTPGTLLAQTHATLLENTTHQVEFFLRDHAIDIHVDGESIFRRAVSLPFALNNARLAISMLANADHEQEAEATIHKARFMRPRSVLASWQLEERYHPYVIQYVHRHGTILTNLSPPLTPPGTLSHENEDMRIFRKLANVYNLNLTPKVSIFTDEALAQWSPDTLTRALSEQRGDGLYVDFTENDTISIPDLDNWLQQTSRMLSGSGKSLLVRLPHMLERLAAVNTILAVLPNIEIVTGRELTGQTTALETRMVQERQITRPTSEQMQNLPEVYTLPEAETTERDGLQTRLRQIETEAEQAFSRGAFESAIAHFTQWHDLAPSQPQPLKRIGDALVNLGYHDEAVGFYRQSLDLQPDNTDLAIRLAKLLIETGSRTSARTILNIYARLFPENADILLAQADWLLRENRRTEARERVAQVHKIEPESFEAALFSLRLAEHEDEKLSAVQELIARSQSDRGRRRLIRAIETHDLLTLQHAYMLIAFLQEDLEDHDDTELQRMVRSLAPRTSAVREDFSDGTGISDHWMLDGLSGSQTNDVLTLQTLPTRSGASVRLRRSERWRDSFIEANLESAQGGFWMYARQANRQLVRLGFEPAQNRLHLQIWGGPQFDVLQSEFIPWRFPSEGVTLRLETRGHGAIGYIDDNPMFDAPLELPDDFGFGWTSFTIESPARGDAQVSLRHLESGPLPFRTAAVPDTPPDDDDDLLDRIHTVLPNISDLSPDWFRVDENGQWHSQVHPESDFYRIFARYYRLRLTPLVRVAAGAQVEPDDLIILTRTHGFGGFILLFETMPDNQWFADMHKQLNIPGLDLIAVAQAAPGRSASVRGIAGSSTLFPRADAANPISVLQFTDLEDIRVAAELEARKPAIVFFQ